MLYQLENKARYLCHLCSLWRTPAMSIDPRGGSWGPPEALILQMGMSEPATEHYSEGSDCEEDHDDDSVQSDGDLCDQLEFVALHDEYLPADSGYSVDIPYLLTEPRKRRRDP